MVRLFRQFNRRYNKALEPFGLSSVQAHILGVLWTEGPMTIGALRDILSMGSGTLSGALDRMEKAELLTRERAPGDRRAYLLKPAPWKAKRRNRVLEVLAETEDELLGALTQAERKQLVSLLAKVSESLE